MVTCELSRVVCCLRRRQHDMQHMQFTRMSEKLVKSHPPPLRKHCLVQTRDPVFLTAPLGCLLWTLPCLSTGPRLTVVFLTFSVLAQRGGGYAFLGLIWGSVMHRGAFLHPNLRQIDATLITVKPIALPLRRTGSVPVGIGTRSSDSAFPHMPMAFDRSTTLSSHTSEGRCSSNATHQRVRRDLADVELQHGLVLAALARDVDGLDAQVLGGLAADGGERQSPPAHADAQDAVRDALQLRLLVPGGLRRGVDGGVEADLKGRGQARDPKYRPLPPTTTHKAKHLGHSTHPHSLPPTPSPTDRTHTRPNGKQSELEIH